MDTYTLHNNQWFVWDRAKAESNVAKHRVFFEQAVEAFFDVFAIFEDASGMGDESRMSVIGLISGKKILYVVHLVPRRWKLDSDHFSASRDRARTEAL